MKAIAEQPKATKAMKAKKAMKAMKAKKAMKAMKAKKAIKVQNTDILDTWDAAVAPLDGEEELAMDP